MTLALPAADEAMLLAAPLFNGLGRTAALALVDGAAVAHHPDGGLLFSAGDPADRFFLLLAGRVDLFALTEAGSQSIIEIIEPGQTFAEAAVFADGRFPLNAGMAPATRLLVIPARPFLDRLTGPLTFQLLASLARRQRSLIEEIATLKRRTPAQRLGLFLLARAAPQALGDEVREWRLPYSKADLASHIGITPESLSRALARLRPLGISSRAGAIVIADPAALRRYCATLE